MMLFALASPALTNPSELTFASVDEVITHALASNPDLEEYALRQKKARKDYNSVRFHWLPTLSGSFAGQRNAELSVTPLPGELFGQPGTTVDAQFGQEYSYKTGLTLSKSILDVQARYASKIAKVSEEITRANETAYKQQLTEQVALNYYTAIITHTLLENQQMSTSDADQIVAIVASRFREGVVDQSAVNRAHMNKNTALKNQFSYQDVLEQSYHNLRLLLGIPVESELVLNERLSAMTNHPPLVEGLGADPALFVEELTVRQSHFRLKEQKAAWLPKFDLSLYWGKEQYRDNFGLSFDDTDWSDTETLYFSVSIPLFTGFSRRSKIQSAKAEYDLARAMYEREQQASHIRDNFLLSQRQIYRQQAEITRESYRLAKDNATLALQKYEQGVISLDQYLDAINEERNSEAVYLDALLQYYHLYATFISRGNYNETT
jgi:outer membrane protein TolC